MATAEPTAVKPQRKYVRIISATKNDTVQVMAADAQGLEDDINRFLSEKAPEQIQDIRLLAVGVRDAWGMIIYTDEQKG
jgi:hypothetical protein